MVRLLVLASTVGAGLHVHTRALKVSSDCGNVGVASFEGFVEKHGRTYTGEEYKRRKELFETRVAHISSHNCADEHPWTAEVNHLADWTDSELRGLRSYQKPSGSNRASASSKSTVLRASTAGDIPDGVSYAHLESIKKPRDQGDCGSCWAHAATTVLDAHAELNNKSHSFSVAQVIACTPNPHHCGGGGGCSGATTRLAYEYALQISLASQMDFPDAQANHPCPEDKKAWGTFVQTGESTPAVHMLDGTEKHLIEQGSDTDRMSGPKTGLLGWTRFPENKEMQLLRGLIDYGPVAVAVAPGADWNWYSQGIMAPYGCDAQNVVSHAMVLYGYGKAMNVRLGAVKYWHLKNSWGRHWGEDGSIRLQKATAEEEHCGWDNSPEVGYGCDGGPKQIWVCGSCGILFDALMPYFRL